MNTTIILIFLAFFLMIAMGVPIAYSMGITGVTYMLMNGITLQMAVQRFFSNTQSFSFLAVPFFILAGNLMVESGIAMKIIRFADVLVRQLPGGLGCVSVVTSMLLAGVSGSSVADAASVGSILIPEMNRKGYDESFSVAINATSSTVGIIIPPSSTMIIIAWITNLSVAKMFIAGAIPGILLGLMYLAITIVMSIRRKYPREKRATLREVGKSLVDTAWALLLPVILLGSIIGGFATPTQSASLAALYALILGVLVYGTLDFKAIYRSLAATAKGTTSVMMVVCSASIFQWILVRENIPAMISSWLLGMGLSKNMLLLVMVCMLFVAGMIMDNVPNLFIFLPIFMPIAISLGVDPIQFSIVTLVALALGLFTPPIGTTLFISCAISKTRIEECILDLIPFFAGGVIIVLAITYIPALTLWLPGLFF